MGFWRMVKREQVIGHSRLLKFKSLDAVVKTPCGAGRPLERVASSETNGHYVVDSDTISIVQEVGHESNFTRFDIGIPCLGSACGAGASRSRKAPFG
jgi:hypothetical protein